MNSDIESLSATAAGFKRAAHRLEQLRIKDIRDSNTATALQSFDLAFKFALQNPLVRETHPLSKAQRIFFGVDV